MGTNENEPEELLESKPTPRWKRILKNPWARVGIYLGLFILGGCMFADRAFYVPYETAPRPPIVEGYEIEEVGISVADATLSAWVLEPTTTPVKGTVLYSHGNAGNLANHIGFADFLPQNGYRMILYDYRGYGASTGGKPTRDKTIEDAHAALDWTIERYGQVWMVGQSLGASLSIYVGGERSKDIEGVVAIAPFTSYRAIAREVLGKTIVLWPVKWPMSLFVSSGGDPELRVGDISPKPLLIVHGEEDEIIPPRMGEELYRSAGEPKEFAPIPGMGHNDGWRSANREFKESILNFLKRHGPGLPES